MEEDESGLTFLGEGEGDDNEESESENKDEDAEGTRLISALC